MIQHPLTHNKKQKNNYLNLTASNQPLTDFCPLHALKTFVATTPISKSCTHRTRRAHATVLSNKLKRQSCLRQDNNGSHFFEQKTNVSQKMLFFFRANAASLPTKMRSGGKESSFDIIWENQEVYFFYYFLLVRKNQQGINAMWKTWKNEMSSLVIEETAVKSFIFK